MTTAKVKIMLFLILLLTFCEVEWGKVGAECTPGVCITTQSGSPACGDFYPDNYPMCIAGVILCRNDFCDEEQ